MNKKVAKIYILSYGNLQFLLNLLFDVASYTLLIRSEIKCGKKCHKDVIAENLILSS